MRTNAVLRRTLATLIIIAAVAGCARPATAPGPGGAILHIAQPVPGTVQLTAAPEPGATPAGGATIVVTARNVGGSMTRLEYGACSIVVRAYRTPQRTGAPAFDGAVHFGEMPCIMIGYESRLDPGGSVEIRGAYGRIPAGVLENGQRYYLSAVVWLNGQSATVDAGEL